MICTDKANSILNSLFPTSAYIGLSTSQPTVSGSNFTEPSELCGTDSDGNPLNGYKRVQLSKMGTAKDGQITTTDIIFFPETQGDGWGTVAYFGVFNAIKGGTPYFWGVLTTPIQIPGVDSNGNGYIPIFRAGALKVALDREVT